MVMEVLLMQDIDGLGKQGDIVKVSDGYARNYLFPKGLAGPVTPAYQRKLAKLKEQQELEKRKKIQEAAEKAALLRKKSCSISVETHDDGKLYGSVTPAMIAEALTQQGIPVEKSQVILKEPIRTVGVYEVTVELHPEIQVPVKVWVVEK